MAKQHFYAKVINDLMKGDNEDWEAETDFSNVDNAKLVMLYEENVKLSRKKMRDALKILDELHERNLFGW